jgi:hypothetical protein
MTWRLFDRINNENLVISGHNFTKFGRNITDNVLRTAPDMFDTRKYSSMHFTHNGHIITAGFPSAALHVNYIVTAIPR